MFLEPQTTVWQYTHGVPDTTRASPDGYGLDNNYLSRSGAHEIQLDERRRTAQYRDQISRTTPLATRAAFRPANGADPAAAQSARPYLD